MLSSLLLGTTSGVWLCAAAQAPKCVLPGPAFVTHLAVTHSGVVAAAVPRLALQRGELHALYPFSGELEGADRGGCHELRRSPGVHLLRPAPGGTSAADAAAAEYSAECVWAGDARSVCAWDLPLEGEQSSSEASLPAVGLAVGTEPADVFTSVDSGRTWSEGTASFRDAPSREGWTFPAPPHEAHVLSLERLPPEGSGDGGGGGSDGSRLIAGIEVGGVLVGCDARGAAYEERSEGLYVDVHSCRVDPHDPRHWLAVTGRGLYGTRNAGFSWRPQAPEQWAGKYTVGLAMNPEVQGEVMVAAGDRPPGLGVHVFHSSDGGDSWRDITDGVFRGECAEAKGTRTPVPYFCGGQALLGTDTGQLLAAGDAGRREWRPVCRVPHPILCMAAPGQSPSSIMH